MTSLLERLFTWIASLFGKDMVFDFDNFTPHCMLAIALCCLALFMGTRSGETTTKVETKMTSHEDSLVQLHNELVNWNDSDFDELWGATVKYKLTKSDDDEYHEVVKVIKEVKQDRDNVRESVARFGTDKLRTQLLDDDDWNVCFTIIMFGNDKHREYYLDRIFNDTWTWNFIYENSGKRLRNKMDKMLKERNGE